MSSRACGSGRTAAGTKGLCIGSGGTGDASVAQASSVDQNNGPPRGDPM
jgi:hypothetical protein